jgi:ATP-dependent Clp protease protease subunit
MEQPPVPKIEVYAAFCDNINQSSVQRIFQNLAVASNPANNIKHVHLLFQSAGGYVGDGICLYNFFRSLPIECTIYNTGSVQSIAVLAFLGVKNRKTSAHAVFTLHRSTMGPQPTTAGGLEALAKSLALEDARTEPILREHIRMSDDRWAIWKNGHDWESHRW